MSCNSLTHNLRRRVSLISVMESKNSKGPSTFQCVTPDLAVVVLVLLSSNTTGFIFYIKAWFQSSWLLGEWNNSFSACVDVNVLQYRTVHWNPNHNRVAVILALLWLFFHCVHMLLFAKWFCYSFFGNMRVSSFVHMIHNIDDDYMFEIVQGSVLFLLSCSLQGQSYLPLYDYWSSFIPCYFSCIQRLQGMASSCVAI